MLSHLKSCLSTRLAIFRRDASGAVSVEWVVLTAACIGLGVGAAAMVMGSSENVATTSNSQLSAAMAEAGEA